MKTASRVMYIIGIIGNIATFIFAVIAMIVLLVSKANPDLANQIQSSFPGQSLDAVVGLGLGLVIYLAVATLVVLIISFRALKKGASVAVHIVLLVGGVLAWNPFYVLGAIFGLISGK